MEKFMFKENILERVKTLTRLIIRQEATAQQINPLNITSSLATQEAPSSSQIASNEGKFADKNETFNTFESMTAQSETQLEIFEEKVTLEVLEYESEEEREKYYKESLETKDNYPSFEEELEELMQKHLSFYSKEGSIDLGLKHDDHILLEDIDNFDLKKYLKKIYYSRYNPAPEDKFPLGVIATTIAFVISFVFLKYFWIGWVMKDIMKDFEERKSFQAKNEIRASLGGKDEYLPNTASSFPYYRYEKLVAIQWNSFVKNSHELEKPYRPTE